MSVDLLPFDWTQMPRILESRRAMAVRALIGTDDPTATIKHRAEVHLLDELLRLPKTEQEEREFRNSTREIDDDD